jgi:cyclopropane fatty-acyl-phospholipid synthase-like methyltransferase
MSLDSDSLERIVPDSVDESDVTGAEALRISIERYEFASRHVRPGRLLDIACGVGYGTRLLGDRAPQAEQALGVDLSKQAIEYANSHYANERVQFVAEDAMQFASPGGFDTIVSIETIEHLPEPARFVDRLTGMLNRDAILITSVPVTPSIDANPHHLHDFTATSFRRLFRRHGLVEIDAFEQEQPYSLSAVVTRSEARLSDMRRNLPLWYLKHPVSLVRRIEATLRFGFKNRYLTIAWEQSSQRQSGS